MKTIARGKTADYDDFIVTRRINILKAVEGFTGEAYSLLDVGCGNGGSLIKLSGHFGICHGIDVDARNLDQLKKKIESLKLSNVSYSQEDATGEFCPDREFDRIISFEVLEHVKDDYQAARNIYHKLKPSGRVAISVPNRWWIFETHGAYLPVLPWNRVPFFSWLPKKLHDKYAKARIYRKKDILKILISAGFSNIELHYITAPMDVIKWAPLQRFFRKTLFKNDTTSIPFLATSIMVTAAK
ncbi:MAG: methyltransferase domain-containing protein [FCB group bacterium]|nr:methyltransferase domain-containing protein [FCB group bacterium]